MPPSASMDILEGQSGAAKTAALDLVYYLFRVHHWTPEMYWGMGQGGRDLTYALALQEFEDRRNQPPRR